MLHIEEIEATSDSSRWAQLSVHLAARLQPCIRGPARSPLTSRCCSPIMCYSEGSVANHLMESVDDLNPFFAAGEWVGEAWLAVGGLRFRSSAFQTWSCGPWPSHHVSVPAGRRADGRGAGAQCLQPGSLGRLGHQCGEPLAPPGDQQCLPPDCPAVQPVGVCLTCSWPLLPITHDLFVPRLAAERPARAHQHQPCLSC